MIQHAPELALIVLGLPVVAFGSHALGVMKERRRNEAASATGEDYRAGFRKCMSVFSNDMMELGNQIFDKFEGSHAEGYRQGFVEGFGQSEANHQARDQSPEQMPNALEIGRSNKR